MSMMFNYYDLLAHIIPGASLLALAYEYNVQIMKNSNSAVELFYLIVLSFVFGHALSFLSKFIIGVPLKLEGKKSLKFVKMSSLFYQNINEDIILDTLGIDEKLHDKKIIYEKILAYARNKGIDNRAEVHKSLYGFYRNMTLCAIIALILASYNCILDYSLRNVIICFISIMTTIAFIFRTKEHESIRIKKIFYSTIIDIRSKINLG